MFKLQNLFRINLHTLFEAVAEQVTQAWRVPLNDTHECIDCKRLFVEYKVSFATTVYKCDEKVVCRFDQTTLFMRKTQRTSSATICLPCIQKRVDEFFPEYWQDVEVITETE